MKHLILSALLLGLAGCASTAEPTPERQPITTPAADSSWFALEDMQGARHDLGESFTEGREVALVFWQTWCASCIQEAPEIVKAARRRAGTTDFFGVISGPDGVVDDEKVRDMTAKLGLTYPQVRDRSAELAERFEVAGTPTIVVIDPDGKIAFRGHQLPESWNTSASQH